MKPPRLRLRGRAAPDWAVALLLVALALAAWAPYLGVGFTADDYIFLSMIEGALPYDPLPGFWFSDAMEHPCFASLWWAEPGAGGVFLRPLASWTIELLYDLFGRSAVPYHVLLVVLHGLTAFAAFLLWRRLAGRAGFALLAALLFLLCEDHAMTVAWITTVTDLLGALLLILALLTHVAARQAGRRALFWLSLPLFLAALAAKETAVVYPALVILYELFYADARATDAPGAAVVGGAGSGGLGAAARLRALGGRWLYWSVPLLMGVAWFAAYRRLVPPMRSLMYVDPSGDPAGYLLALLGNLPVMVAGWLTPYLPSLAIMMPGTRTAAAVAGWVLLALLLAALWPHRRERAPGFALAALVLALLPGLAAGVGERQLYLPTAFGMLVAARLLLQPAFLRRRFLPDAAPGPRLAAGAWAAFLALAVVATPAAMLFAGPGLMIPGMRLPERTVQRLLPLVDPARHEHVVLLNTSSAFNTFYLPDIYRYHRGEYVDLRPLSSFNGRVEARAAGPRALELRTAGDGWLGNMFACIVRVTPRLAAGDVHETPLFTATILETNPAGDDLRRARFDFARPLDDPALRLLFWDGARYRAWEPATEWQPLNTRVDPHGY
ncbi:MAG: glycosyltransferase family 39 protein [Candidatus Krumholzibacteriota bacterium]|nr:glycosyltransferase family 39 protein [Candidatus Krumholzibacteriota bacterium]